MNPGPTRRIPGLESIHRRYDALLVDAWGVLHDGARCYPGAVECLRRLRRAGKPVVVLSNAARRVDALRAEFAGVGIGDALYHDLLSSGELCWRALCARTPAFTRGAQRACYLGPARSRSLCDGLDFDWREDPAGCAFVLNAGAPEGNPADSSRCEPLLRRMLAQRLPMVCANPDQYAVRAGVSGISAGAIARHYQRLGAAEVLYFGKPDADIYRHALALLDGVERRRVLAVGDGLDTDIAGAAAFGLDSLWITGGIHAAELEAGDVSAESLLSARGLRPTWIVDRLRWEGAR